MTYRKSDGKQWLSDADSIATMPINAMATEAGSANDSKKFLLKGFARHDSWGWTVGGLIYASGYAGSLTQSIAALTTGGQVQVIGIAMTANTIWFDPNLVMVEVL
ncbi:MAG: hypothetical protein CSYNP_01576 [Syntrophus sp. SKADARSKE-3]|nr:hypothetical protein [Syntrophus sp. SKADARSKE-3]